MTDRQFTEGQRVWHHQRREHGLYIKQDIHSDESIVDFPSDDYCRVTTAQLVPAEQVTA